MTLTNSPSETAHGYAVGIGFRLSCSEVELHDLIERSLGKAGLNKNSVGYLATIDSKVDSPIPEKIAHSFGWQLQLHSGEALTTCCQQHSELLSASSQYVNEAVGSPNVAECAALLTLSKICQSPVMLVLPKQKSRQATVAIAGLCTA